MAGHSKWANIKRQKARVDAVKGKVFTKISREIIVAARSGVPDPAANFQLRTAIEKAKAASIPADNIDRAIAKGAGRGADNVELEAIRYEGYGSGGVAVLIEALTDNRNRTAATLREAFSKNGGNLGESGCVGWMFEQKGLVEVVMTTSQVKRGRNRTLDDAVNEEEFLDVCLEGGAETYELIDTEDGTVAEVLTEVENLEALSQTLKNKYTVSLVDLRWIPTTTIEVDHPDRARSILKLMDALEDLDDVQTVTANFEMTADLMASTFA
ncbi:YebC/PmpR family DNA-binding transcriptional regulator [Phormidesmis priestleyi ULC007]|uniref:Probable transcriptional regulatory protein C7B65_14590 n=1 Tax=Phormidesmis priestleyi ULC007 TaxID=1920490 RepID=A0A2T1DE53_9CYAN|nr:YebC/PmpR family DNA-binding transcriptional regulator [Phormidesmis priestleyi]PSB18744.1 YebC/PmpR family DNA-binding transcriptional regulator [Phormidesmis priestleyi ULC007]PZO51496.1 MAG: YebC/PmpR family DNA-binding transcriptional regulator [Phormidesmis priestleyi]